jgi:two-component system NtrC family response regulator
MRRISTDDTPRKALRLLFADDERSLQELMRLELPGMGHEVTVCPDGTTAVTALEENSYDCLILDLDMPGLGGIDVLTKARELNPDSETIILTGKASLDTAIAALRQGAFDYLTKPCRLIELEAILDRVAEKRELTNKYRALERQLRRIQGPTRMVGESPAMQRVGRLIAKVAPTNSTVLILGETGTGKELVARSLHEQSHRRDMPFVAVNCGALPETLIESELFGHKRGSFTGADEHRVGLFEVANHGTLFLDEIGELPKAMQAKLLRVLESGEIRRVGENEPRLVDVRVVCATHRNLAEMVENGEFREDLLFRINAFEIDIPPLRQRLDDIPALAEHLLARFRGSISGDRRDGIAPEAVNMLMSHTWPGNVRELANVVEHATILAGAERIEPEHLPANFMSRKLTGGRKLGAVTLRDLEMQAIQESIARNDGNKPKAAEELGISLKTLYNRLNQVTILDKSA